MWYVIVCVFGGSGQLVHSILWFDDRCVLCQWIDGFEWISLQFVDWVGFRFVWIDFDDLGCIKTIRLICNGSAGFFLLIWVDFSWFQRFGRLGWVRIDLGIFGELGLVNLIGLFDFYGFELFGWIWVDFNRFAWICADLGWLERIAVYLEDRYKFILLDLEEFVEFV